MEVKIIIPDEVIKRFCIENEEFSISEVKDEIKNYFGMFSDEDIFEDELTSKIMNV